MKQVIEKYFCDYCKSEMSEFKYQQGTKITVKVYLPNPKSGCGQGNGVDMVLCNECSKDLGVINSDEYHNYIYSQSRLGDTIEKIKTKILDMFFRKQ